MVKCKKDIVGHICDNVMWYVIYLLPLLLLLLAWFNDNTLSLVQVLTDSGLGFIVSNPVTDTVIQIFGVNGAYPLFSDNSILIYLTYFVAMVLAHLVIDILLYIPRMCHHFVNHGWGGASHE